MLAAERLSPLIGRPKLLISSRGEEGGELGRGEEAYLGHDVCGVGEVGVAVLASVDDVARRRQGHQEQPPHHFCLLGQGLRGREGNRSIPDLRRG